MRPDIQLHLGKKNGIDEQRQQLGVSLCKYRLVAHPDEEISFFRDTLFLRRCNQLAVLSVRASLHR